VEADELIEALKEAAKERMLDGKGNPVKLISQGTEENKTCHKLAETFNTNRTYVNEAAKLRDEKPEIFQQVKSGEKTITEAKREIKREEIIRKNDEIIKQEAIQPTGKYDVIVIDPPWQMKKIEREVAPEQVEFDYPTMDYDEILNIEIPASDNCHIFLWTTQKHLPYAFEILEKWGANYVFTMVWHKNGGFQPFGLPQYNCEFCLYGKIGTPEFLDFKQFPTCFNADRTGHSEKPQYFYDLLNRVTIGRKLDMFNRRKIEGFDAYGNEAG
jgi:N6-adenosine-specific RNA methylase IME4